MEKRLEIHFLRCDEGKSFAEIYRVMFCETGYRVDTRAVVLSDAVRQHTVDKI
jgi:hypothetical protein